MKIISVVLFALLICLLAGLLLWGFVLPMPSSSNKKVLLTFTAIITILAESLLIFSATIPSKADKLITKGINELELGLNNAQPDVVNEEMSADELRAALSNVSYVREHFGGDDEVGFVVRLIGAHVYIDYLEQFTCALDENIREMQAENTPITIHNILLRLQDMSQSPVLKVTKIVEIVIIVLALLLLFVLLIIYFIMRNDTDQVAVQSDGKSTKNNSRVTIADDAL